jgi:hypothetical protein
VRWRPDLPNCILVRYCRAYDSIVEKVKEDSDALLLDIGYGSKPLLSSFHFLFFFSILGDSGHQCSQA